MLRSTFQLLAKMGAGRERKLWEAGLTDWHDLETVEKLPGVPTALATGLRQAAQAADADWQRNDLCALAHRIPRSEHWRFFPHFEQQAICLDIETDREDGITTIGLLREDGPHLLLAGRNLEQFPDLVPPDALLLTFNGLSFDVPHLKRAFPDWQAPVAHFDLRHVWARLGFGGGLKPLERRMGLRRPDHLQALDGSAAAWMWRHARNGDHSALTLLAQYNLYDTINLRTLAAMAYNRMIETNPLPVDPIPVSHRGDVLYDVSKLVMALA